MAAAEAPPAAARARAMQAPSAAEQAMGTGLQQLHVQVQQVSAGQGSPATRERRERRIHGGNRRGAERQRLHGQAMPAAVAAGASTAAAPMLAKDSNGGGGADPRKRPREGRSEALGQRSWVAVVRPAGPPPRAPASAQSSARKAPTSRSAWAMGGGCYAADNSSTSDDWSELLSPGSN